MIGISAGNVLRNFGSNLIEGIKDTPGKVSFFVKESFGSLGHKLGGIKNAANNVWGREYHAKKTRNANQPYSLSVPKQNSPGAESEVHFKHPSNMDQIREERFNLKESWVKENERFVNRLKRAGKLQAGRTYGDGELRVVQRTGEDAVFQQRIGNDWEDVELDNALWRASGIRTAIQTPRSLFENQDKIQHELVMTREFGNRNRKALAFLGAQGKLPRGFNPEELSIIIRKGEREGRLENAHTLKLKGSSENDIQTVKLRNIRGENKWKLLNSKNQPLKAYKPQYDKLYRSTIENVHRFRTVLSEAGLNPELLAKLDKPAVQNEIANEFEDELEPMYDLNREIERKKEALDTAKTAHKELEDLRDEGGTVRGEQLRQAKEAIDTAQQEYNDAVKTKREYLLGQDAASSVFDGQVLEDLKNERAFIDLFLSVVGNQDLAIDPEGNIVDINTGVKRRKSNASFQGSMEKIWQAEKESGEKKIYHDNETDIWYMKFPRDGVVLFRIDGEYRMVRFAHAEDQSKPLDNEDLQMAIKAYMQFYKELDSFLEKEYGSKHFDGIFVFHPTTKLTTFVSSDKVVEENLNSIFAGKLVNWKFGDHKKIEEGWEKAQKMEPSKKLQDKPEPKTQTDGEEEE